jgi:large subunit ribosomal protein L19
MRLSGSAQDLIHAVEAPQLKARLPRFGPGDTVRVTLRIPEGDKERLQLFEGVVIARRGGGTREMVTVRKISFGIGVERQIPLHSPFVAKFELVTRGRARRAKLYFLRDRTGKSARLKKQYGELAVGVDSASAKETPEMVAAAEAEAAKAVEAEKAKAEAKAAEKAAAKAKAKDDKEKAKAEAKAKAKAAKEPAAAA